ncbi:MAG: alpha/beta-hydrolase N-terminal domain-containing protein, partial [Aestuariivirga sp.]
MPDRQLKYRDRPLLSPPQALGLVLGALAFLAALSPSLIPRTGMLQGAVAGLSFAALYGVGAGTGFLWTWLGLPTASRQGEGRFRLIAIAIAAAIMIYGLSQATGWQNAIHAVMGMPPVESARPFTIAAVSLATATVILMIGRLFRRVTLISAARLDW